MFFCSCWLSRSRCNSHVLKVELKQERINLLYILSCVYRTWRKNVILFIDFSIQSANLHYDLLYLLIYLYAILMLMLTLPTKAYSNVTNTQFIQNCIRNLLRYQ